MLLIIIKVIMNSRSKSPFNFPKAQSFLFGKADVDIEKFIQGLKNNTSAVGNFYDSRNARTMSYDGHKLALSKIKGEQLLYSNTEYTADYKCIGSVIVHSSLVEFWADRTLTYNALCTIDGMIVINSNRFYLHPDYELQIAKNDNSIGGEVYITDFRIPPMYFSITDLINAYNTGSTRYTTEFKPERYYINLEATPEAPIFEGLEVVGGGGGLPPGGYVYSFRFVSTDGEKVSWSAPTPIIEIPERYVAVEGDVSFPFLKYTGGDTNPDAGTAYGAKIKFRINNVYGYSYIEIKRTSYNRGEGLGFVPSSYIVKRISIAEGEFTVYHYTDSIAGQDTPIAVSADDETDNLSSISRARAIAYFSNRVVLGNVSYFSRNIDQIEFLKVPSTDDVSFFPILKNLGSKGFKDPVVSAYEKSLMHEESYGWAVVGWDAGSKFTFAKPIPGFKSYQMPKRRTKTSEYASQRAGIPSYNFIGLTTTNCIALDNTVDDTFEPVDYSSSLNRLSPVATGSEDNGKYVNVLNVATNPSRAHGSIDASEVGYQPFNPVSNADTITENLQYLVNNLSFVDDSTPVDYNPYGFAPRIGTLGMMLKGITNIPDYVKAISIVRTKRANKVIAQGLAFYDFENVTSGGTKYIAKKNNSIIFNSPDFDSGLVDPRLIDDMKVNPQNYKIHLAAPYGIFSEIYHFKKGGGLVDESAIDMVVFPRVQEEKDVYISGVLQPSSRRCNPGELAQDVGVADITTIGSLTIKRGVISFDKWRGDNSDATGNTVCNIVAVRNKVEEEGVSFLEIEFDGNLYLQNQTSGENQFNDTNVKKWHEPFYIVNIIQEGAEVPDSDSTQYDYIGNFIKLSSLVGYGNGGINQFYEICGERIEDFHCEYPDVSSDRYCYVDELDNGTKQRWINVNNKDSSQKAIIAADITNGTTIFNGLRLYGMYTSDKEFIYFNQGYNPVDGAAIYIDYDNRFPISVFGGDSVIGEHVYAPVHRSSPEGGGNGKTKQLEFRVGFPYYTYRQVANYYIPENIKSGSTNKIQVSSDCRLQWIRQMIVCYHCQSYTNTSLLYGDYFPQKNFIVRPLNWKSNTKASEQGQPFFTQYDEDYQGEYQRWRYGGFRFKQFPTNMDYSKNFNVFRFFRKPTIGFKENLDFPTRVTSSLSRPISQRLSPNLKSFRPFNYFDLSDENGAIKYLFASFVSGMGDNLYAFAENDICLLMTDKRTLSDLSGNEIALVATSGPQLIRQQIWLRESKMKGMPSECWRSFASFGGIGFWANRNGVFALSNNKVSDITEGYVQKLFPNILDFIDENCKLVGGFDTRFEEYYLLFKVIPFVIEYNVFAGVTTVNLQQTSSTVFTITEPAGSHSAYGVVLKNMAGSTDYYFIVNAHNSIIFVDYEASTTITTVSTNTNFKVSVNRETGAYTITSFVPSSVFKEYLYVFSAREDSKGWMGEYDFTFDKMASEDASTFISRSLKSFQIHKGFKINGQSIVFKSVSPFAPEVDFQKEAKRVAINSNRKPLNGQSSVVQLLYYNGTSFVLFSSLTSAQLKDYGYYEQWIPVDGSSKRLQGLVFGVVVQDSDESDFSLIDIILQYQRIK